LSSTIELVLGAGLDAVVVVIPPGVRIGLAGELERYRNEFRPHGPQPRGIAVVFRPGRLRIAAVVDRFVDHAPAPSFSPVAPDQRADVVLHAPDDHRLVGGAARRLDATCIACRGGR
jgi:hypothetical protein